MHNLKREGPSQPNIRNEEGKKPTPGGSVSLELSPNQFALLDYILDVIRLLATRCMVEGASVEPSLTDRESAGLAEVQSLADLLHEREAELVNGTEAEQSILMYMSILWDHYHFFHPLDNLIAQRSRETCYDSRISDARQHFDRLQQAIDLFAPTNDWAGLEAWVQHERTTAESALQLMRKMRLPSI